MTKPPPPPPPFEQPGQPYEQPAEPYVAPEGTYHETSNSKSWAGCLIGCLVAFGACCLLCAGVGYYAYQNASQFIVQTARTATDAALRDSGLPDAERQGIMEQFDRVAKAYENGEITLEEMGEIMEDLAKSPLISIVILQAIETKYLNSSGLSEEEIAEAKRTLARVVRGAQEEKLTKEDIDKLSRHVLLQPDPNKPEERQLKTTMTDEELRAFFAEAKELVDIKEIPDEDFQTDIAETIREAVDKKLGQP